MAIDSNPTNDLSNASPGVSSASSPAPGGSPDNAPAAATTSSAPSMDANRGVVNNGAPQAVPGAQGQVPGGGAAAGRVHSPQVNVEGGKCTITHFDLLQVGIALGSGDDVSNMTQFPPASIRSLTFTTRDHDGRMQLASALEGIAGKLRG